MRAGVCVLLCVLGLCGARICPDGGMCEDENTCCQIPSGGYGCCPLPNAVCCSDHLHCCQMGTVCDLVHAKCVNRTHTFDWVTRIPATHSSSPQAVVCPDEESECPDGTTCCQMLDGSWGCCQMPNAVCCSDKKHCCPHGTTCDLLHSKCVNSITSVPLFKKLPAFRTATHANKAGSVPCNDSVACETGTTCCKTKDGIWACCPLPEAVCCQDHLHCCPHATVCNLEAGTCDSGAAEDQMNRSRAVLLTPQNKRCDKTSMCPVGSTCCKQMSGSWACCPLPQAMCCDDHEHCCPQGYKCDVSHQSCEHPLLPSMPWVSKHAARNPKSSDVSRNSVVALNNKNKCDKQSSCPTGNTCCFMNSTTKWGCCPLPQAVCCKDGSLCCPRGYTCDEHKPVCNKATQLVPWFQKQPALFTQGLGDTGAVKCNETTYCASGSTCCKLPTGQWGCCPLVRAVCCEDHEHCCPEDYTCDLQSGTCLKPAHISTSTPTTLHPTKEQQQEEGEVMCGATKHCSATQSCCRISEHEWGCCPFKQAVCCAGMKHCCPHGYTCAAERGCIRSPPLTWWKDSL